MSIDFGSSRSEMQWKDPGLKVRPLTKSDLAVIAAHQQKDRSDA